MKMTGLCRFAAARPAYPPQRPALPAHAGERSNRASDESVGCRPDRIAAASAALRPPPPPRDCRDWDDRKETAPALLRAGLLPLISQKSGPFRWDYIPHRP